MKYLYLHPFFDERKWAHRFSFQLIRAFENIGKYIERFDYHGTGEAEGKFEEITFDSLHNSILDHLNDNSYCLIGTRLGATIAFNCMNLMSVNIKKLIMINPVIHGSDYINYLFRQQHIKNILTGDSTKDSEVEDYINIEGFKTSKILIEQIRSYSLIKTLNSKYRDIPVHYFCLSANGNLTAEEKDNYEVLKINYPNTNIYKLSSQLFWRRIPSGDYSELINKILECCNES